MVLFLHEFRNLLSAYINPIFRIEDDFHVKEKWLSTAMTLSPQIDERLVISGQTEDKIKYLDLKHSPCARKPK